MSTRNLKFLIFDLGGVIINLETERTVVELALLGGVEPSFIREQYLNHDEFKRYETGAIGDEEFRSFLREILKFKGEDKQLDDAWNAMILDIPAERLALLEKLKENHDLFLLSNTNTIHMHCVYERLSKHGVGSFDPYFHKQYYSHLINRRKPDADIYQFVLDDNNLTPENVLFIDDNADNIEGAANLGIQTLHINKPTALMDFFNG
ncbi:HAD family phosphatase [Fulvivirga sp. 29W222]|uniref:HAD family phosphatase n=1 Tax=Fulvivirga marina TaxID=2494733 RepID=A0A937KBZ8_9BACT|nr:HAD family phosphatase [Fulvivirga marina]MBL6446794.1 HAD family phosphatase [Fulvivirga marina]